MYPYCMYCFFGEPILINRYLDQSRYKKENLGSSLKQWATLDRGEVGGYVEGMVGGEVVGTCICMYNEEENNLFFFKKIKRKLYMYSYTYMYNI